MAKLVLPFPQSDVVRKVEVMFAIADENNVRHGVMLDMETDLLGRYSLIMTGEHLRQIVAEMDEVPTQVDLLEPSPEKIVGN